MSVSIPQSVLDAFGVSVPGSSTPLPGGEAHSILYDERIVFKPTHDPVEAEWTGTLMHELSTKSTPRFRVPRPEGWQLLVRALLFRLGARSEFVRVRGGEVSGAERRRFEIGGGYFGVAMKRLLRQGG